MGGFVITVLYVCVGFCFPQAKVKILSVPTDGHCRKASSSSIMPAPLHTCDC